MQEFFNWCEKNKTTVLPGSKLGKAINYTLKHQETFEHILLDGNLELSNNKQITSNGPQHKALEALL